MNLKNSFYVSIAFYISLLVFIYTVSPSDSELNPIQIQKGSTGIISFVFSKNLDGMSETPKMENTSSLEGTITEEISKIQNKISYPPLALEDGLESECEWSITIDSHQKASQVKTIRPCKYKIFDDEFQKVIHDWKFSLPENTVLNIPVSFKIQKEN